MRGTLISLLLLFLGPGAVCALEPRPPSPLASDVPTDSLVALARRIEPIVAELRQLRFRRPVRVEAISDSAAQAHFRARLAMEWPAERVQAESKVYAHLGLVRAGTQLDLTLLDVLHEQAGGFYDPERGTFFVVGKAPLSILGAVMAHELTHALDDQHYGIDSSYARTMGNADQETAYAAVVEGSGTAVMAAYFLREAKQGTLDVGALAELQESELGRTERFEAAPAILQRQLLAPYVLGSFFLVRGDMSRITSFDSADFDRAFRLPPASFEQVMHPEKYWDLKLLDPPLTVGDIAAARELGKGWTTKFEGTFGELGIAALCDTTHLDLGSLALSGAEAWTHTAAAGWGGDRWWLLERDGKYVTVLALVWDSEQDAREFEKAVHLLPGSRLARRGNALVIVAGEVGKDASRVAKACAATLATKYGAR